MGPYSLRYRCPQHLWFLKGELISRSDLVVTLEITAADIAKRNTDPLSLLSLWNFQHVFLPSQCLGKIVHGTFGKQG